MEICVGGGGGGPSAGYTNTCVCVCMRVFAHANTHYSTTLRTNARALSLRYQLTCSLALCCNAVVEALCSNVVW